MSAATPHPSPLVPQYRIGDLVWCTEGGKKAQLRWPAMVAYDPKLAIYFRTQQRQQGGGGGGGGGTGTGASPSSYHVQYFGVQAVRGWVAVTNMEELKEVGPKATLVQDVAKCKHQEYEVALEEAEVALELTHKERKLRFIFNYDPPGTKRHKKASRRSTSSHKKKKKSRPSNQGTPANQATPSTEHSLVPCNPEGVCISTSVAGGAVKLPSKSHKKKIKSQPSDGGGVVTTPTCAQDGGTPGHEFLSPCHPAGVKGEGACFTPLPIEGTGSNQSTPQRFSHRKSARIGMKRLRESDVGTKETGPNEGSTHTRDVGPVDSDTHTSDVGPTTSGESNDCTNDVGPSEGTSPPVEGIGVVTSTSKQMREGEGDCSPAKVREGEGDCKMREGEGDMSPAKVREGDGDTSPAKIRDCSPAKMRDCSPAKIRDCSPAKIRDCSPAKMRDCSPAKMRDCSPAKMRDCSPAKMRDCSPAKMRDCSPAKMRDCSPAKMRDCSPAKMRDCSPAKIRDCSPAKIRDCSPAKIRDCSPAKIRDCSPAKIRDCSPAKGTSMPAKQTTTSDSSALSCDMHFVQNCLPTAYLTPSSSSTEEEPPRRDPSAPQPDNTQPTSSAKKLSTKCAYKDGKCSICEEEGAGLLLCEGPCGSTFHMDCIGLVQPPRFSFVCDECLCVRRECFLCKGERGEMHKCSRPACERVYHPSCVQAGKLFVAGKKSGSFTCPLHACARCKSLGSAREGAAAVGGALLRCVHCPLALHRDRCLVAGCEPVGSEEMVCYRHVRIDRDRNLYGHINIGTCLECGEPGSLYCCDFCSAAYHDGCLEKEALPSLEGGYWCCPNCVLHDLPAYGSMVICKHGRHRWWPGEVVSPDAIPDNLSSKKPGPCMFVVKFYGTHDYCWTFHGRVLPYTTEGGAIGEGVDKRTVCAEDFIKACTEALQAYPTKKAVTETITEGKNYIRIKANKYLVPRPDIDFPSIPCQCTRDHPCDDDFLCVNRALLTECDPDSCPVGDLCKNQRMLRCQYPETEVVQTGARGWGLKVLQDLKEGDFVIEYVGEILNMEMCQERLRKAHERNRSNFYMFTLDHGLVIDAREKSNPARFINHSCDPNCHTQKWIVSGETRIGIFARHDIQAGTELTFDYQFDSLGNEKKRCHCGSAKCSGFLGLKKKEPPKSKAPKAAKKPKPKAKRRPCRGGMCTDEEAKLYEDECFVCRDGGKLVLCDEKGCTKVYHPSCIGRCKPPASGWICPHHFCDVCYARSTVLCATCPVSYCELHREGKFAEVEGKVVCLESCMDAAGSEPDRGQGGDTPLGERIDGASQSGDQNDGSVPPLDFRNEQGGEDGASYSRQDGLLVVSPDSTLHKLPAGLPDGVSGHTPSRPPHYYISMNQALAQNSLGHTLPQYYLGHTFPQQPLDHTFPQQPLDHTFPQQPMDHMFPQQPLGHTFPQQPLGHMFPQQPLGHTLPQQPLGHTFPQQPLGHMFPQQPLGHMFPQQPLGHTFPQQPLDHTFPQQSVLRHLVPPLPPYTLPPLPAYTISNHSELHLKTSRQSSSPPDVPNEEHPFVSLNCANVCLGVPSNCPIDSSPEKTQKKLVLSI